MVREHKGGIIGDYITDLGLLGQEQIDAIGEEQNQGMIAKLKKDGSLSSKDIEVLEAVAKESPSMPFPELLEKANIDANDPKVAVPFELRFGTLAKKQVSNEDIELANAIQSTDRLEAYAAQGVGDREKSDAKSYVGRFSAPNNEAWIDKAEGLTQRSQAAASVAKLLYSAIEVGGKDVDELSEVQQAKEAAAKLAYVQRKQEMYALEKAGHKEAAAGLRGELEGMQKPAKGEAESSLWEKFVSKIKGALEKVGMKKLSQKLEKWLDNRQLGKLEEKYADQLVGGTKVSIAKLHAKHNATGVGVDKDGLSWLEKREAQLKNQSKDTAPKR